MRFLELVLRDILPKEYYLGGLRAVRVHYRGTESVDQSTCRRCDGLFWLPSDLAEGTLGGCARLRVSGLFSHQRAEQINSSDLCSRNLISLPRHAIHGHQGGSKQWAVAAELGGHYFDQQIPSSSRESVGEIYPLSTLCWRVRGQEVRPSIRTRKTSLNLVLKRAESFNLDRLRCSKPASRQVY